MYPFKTFWMKFNSKASAQSMTEQQEFKGNADPDLPDPQGSATGFGDLWAKIVSVM